MSRRYGWPVFDGGGNYVGHRVFGEGELAKGTGDEAMGPGDDVWDPMSGDEDGEFPWERGGSEDGDWSVSASEWDAPIRPGYDYDDRGW